MGGCMARGSIPTYSRREIINACLNAKIDRAKRDGLSIYRKPFSDQLVEKRFTLRFGDGTSVFLRFMDLHSLEWSLDGRKYNQEYYEAMESTVENVFGIHFYKRNVLPYEGVFLVLDLDEGYAVWNTMHVGTADSDKDILVTPHFGEIDGNWSRTLKKPHYTTKYVGTIIDWKYNDDFTIRHSYVTPTLTTSVALPDADEDEVIARIFLPAFHVEVRPNLFLTSFSEVGGCAAVLLIDLTTVHDIGCFYGLNDQCVLESITVSAVGGLSGPSLFSYTPPFQESEQYLDGI